MASAIYRARGILAAFLISTGLVFWLFRLWKADLAYPLAYTAFGDDTSFDATLKSLVETGNIYENPRLGAPFGAVLYDYAIPEPLQFGALRILAVLGLRSIGPLWNICMLAPFTLTCVTTYVALRMFRVYRPVAILAGVVYTFLPYHMMRCNGHVLLASYWATPLAMALALKIACGDSLFFSAKSTFRIGVPRPGRAEIAALAILIAQGMTGSGYYEFFSAVLLGIAGILGTLRTRKLAPFVSGFVSAVIVSVALFASLAPNLLYTRAHGASSVNERFAHEAEWYGLKIGQLLVPQDWHRWEPMARIARKYNDSLTIINENHTSSLGVVSSLAFLTLLAVVFTAGARFTVNRSANAIAATSDAATKSNAASNAASSAASNAASNAVTARAMDATGAASKLGLFAVLFGTIGGFGALFAVYVSPTIRSYNRISIYVAFFSLAVVAFLVQSYVVPRLKTGASHVRFAALLVAIGALAIYDQTNTSDHVPYGATKESYLAHERFIARIEAAMPPGGMIYQLPYVPYPDEPPYAEIFRYSFFEGYLHSKTLKWSYGDISGRKDDDWHRRLVKKPMGAMLDTLAYSGFSGVWLARRGYPENGVAFEGELRERLGAPFTENDDHQIAVFDLRPYAKALHERMDDAEWEKRKDLSLHPIYFGARDGFFHEEHDARTGRSWRWCPADGTLFVVNASDHPRHLHVHAIVGGFGTSILSFDGVLEDSIEIRAPQPYDHDVTVPPGEHTVHVHSTAPNVAPPTDKRDLHFFLEDLTIEDAP